MSYKGSEATLGVTVNPQTVNTVTYYCDRIGAWHILSMKGVPDAREYEDYPLRDGDMAYFGVQLDPIEPYLEELHLIQPDGTDAYIPRDRIEDLVAVFGPVVMSPGGWTVTVKDYTDSFQVLEAIIATALTISAPGTVLVEESFTVSGVLTRKDTGAGLAGQTINLSYNDTTVGSTTTADDGGYTLDMSIPAAGSYTLKAAYPGGTSSPAYQSAQTTIKLNVQSEKPSWIPLLIAGGLITLLASRR